MNPLSAALVLTLLVAVCAAPQGSSNTPIPIVSQTSDIEPDGSFKYSYETGNGIKAQDEGSLKSVQVQKPDGSGTEQAQALVRTGSFSYPAPDGTNIQLTYTADENGFHPEGAHLPVAPTAQP